MKCPKCTKSNSKVIESREASETLAMRRRRECLSCKQRFTTYERVELPNLLVVKKDGVRELFNRDKLSSGIYKSFEKRPVSADKIEKLIEKIERDAYSLNETEISAKIIGEMVMNELLQLDDVAYVRFASVYRSFTDIESFEKVLNKLKKHHNKI